ncbi:class I SAM-dependent methyltransferase [Alkaliphilus hydrothermalis]|uniref:2-polyprenyl-3-methyl-5-hydroxy-6-metoxy-1, 4-benzoquinol methylase n=1 Tax=Alkaliphilus hydrothermalis TaxID=1482730 RepID=A0ABS2NLH6_9FIRM|nr:methyltransferase domain-containing protein [Alkaliphilus hydrothermalis]MBM7613786.1 2-polyprenyl-3-methyl-5-hydroxy-6-metoxy-1,4-benzoquinol methylase [Alkaliphilus hydrothermalis]
MEYMGNKEFWNKKFIKRGNVLLNPESSLVGNITYFKKGSVLDLACGDGRNDLFLLQEGFKVTGVDFSEEALTRLKDFAKQANYSVNTLQADLNSADFLKDLGVFDNIVINHYRFSPNLLGDLAKHISKDGVLFICGFGHKHRVDDRIKKEDLIQPSDLESLKNSFQQIKEIVSDDERGFIITYLYRRK